VFDLFSNSFGGLISQYILTLGIQRICSKHIIIELYILHLIGKSDVFG
jgi:hypothetical protein